MVTTRGNVYYRRNVFVKDVCVETFDSLFRGRPVETFDENVKRFDVGKTFPRRRIVAAEEANVSTSREKRRRGNVFANARRGNV